MLAQLFSIFLSKESFEHLLAPHHGAGKGAGAEDAAHHDQHGLPRASSRASDDEVTSSWPYVLASFSSSAALVLSAYAVKSGPFQHVLTAATSSSLQVAASLIRISAGACCGPLAGSLLGGAWTVPYPSTTNQCYVASRRHHFPSRYSL